MFRRKFWWSLLLSVPVVVTSPMVMDWFGYELDFPGMEWVGPILGSVIFFWGGWPFLDGGRRELKERQPGMMLLIAMAITVAYVASMATSLDAFDLDFWWELAALVTIMLLGHWQEMRALGQAQDALAALAALLPDEASGSGEIAGLYTLTRFLGEGVGGHLVGWALERARELRLSYCFGCTTSERVGAFFERNGFKLAAPDEIPATKWRGYASERRSRVRCYRRDLEALTRPA